MAGSKIPNLVFPCCLTKLDSKHFFRKEKRKNHNRIMSFKQNGGTFENFGELLERL
jgi:hypothetical protein